MYYKWSKDFVEAGKRRLNGDTVREANTEEANDLRYENVTYFYNETVTKFSVVIPCLQCYNRDTF